MKVHRIKGFSDILPGEVEVWQAVEAAARQVFENYNFAEIRIPILEKSELFSRSLGESTDVVEKEMYTFPDHGSGSTLVSLRPEGTAGVVRAYTEGALHQVEPVRKLYYLGPMFRRERPQKGRLRQFHQIGAEALGRSDPFVDVEMMLLLQDFFGDLGIEGTRLDVNSIGCATCRPEYRNRLLAFLEDRRDGLCDDCKRRMERNPLRVFDCKQESCAAIVKGAPSIRSHLCDACQAHFETVVELLGQAALEFNVNERLVRGLDYYCRTTFEWKDARLGAQDAVAAGGRYDGLVKALGGPPTAGVGFALGVERLMLLLAQKSDDPKRAPLVYFAWIGEVARCRMFPLAHQVRRAGVRVEIEGQDRSLKSQMRRADKLGARLVLILGPEELEQGRAVLRHMETKQQSEVDLNDLEERIVASVRAAP